MISVEAKPPAHRTRVRAIVYPDSDGKPMADNTLQFRCIAMLKSGFSNLFRDREDVFVAGDLLWYPVEGKPTVRAAPDTLIAFGRPSGDRGSYKQWEENDVAPQVVWEVMSPGNRASEMRRKFEFYERHGVEEYMIYDPDHGTLEGWSRENGRLKRVADVFNWTSPRTSVRFRLRDKHLEVIRPDGRCFETDDKVFARAEAAEERAALLEAKLRAMGVDPASI